MAKFSRKRNQHIGGVWDEQYGNGVQATFAYDAMNRQVGRWACLYTTHAGCALGTHLEGSAAEFTGNKVTRLINEQGDNTLGYDDLGRLSSRVSAGGGTTLSWTYDRFGNRLSQTASGTGSGSFPQPSFSVDPGSNRMTGFTYDQAGNVINDGLHSYTYDQEGNLIYVDGGQTAWDDYDALNRRVMHATGDLSVINNYKRYEYGLDGRVTDVWRGEDTYENLARYYGPKGDSFAYWTGGVNLSNEQVHYQHTDYLGTVKARTDPNHNLEGTYSDLPFGERTAAAGTDDNAEHYAGLDRDTESDTHHAQFRTYEPRIGRWLQPDPYDGSYDYNNPQSWNRYSYVMNNPLSSTDPSGQAATCDSLGYDGCDQTGGGGGDGGDDGLMFIHGNPNNYFGSGWDEFQSQEAMFAATTYITKDRGTTSSIDYGDGSRTPVGSGAEYSLHVIPGFNITTLIQGVSPGTAMIALSNPVPAHGWWHYGNYCGPGGAGTPKNSTDSACATHDACYTNGGFSPGSNFTGPNTQLQSCNQNLCNAVRARKSALTAQAAGNPLRTSRGVSPGSALPPNLYKELQAADDIDFYFTWAIAPFGSSCHQ